MQSLGIQYQARSKRTAGFGAFRIDDRLSASSMKPNTNIVNNIMPKHSGAT